MIIQNHQDFTPKEQKNYNQLCAKKIADDVQSKTGFTGINVERISSHVETFIGLIKYTISVDYEKVTSADRKSPSEYAIPVSDEEELKMRISLQQREDINDEILRAKIYDYLKNSKYGQIIDDVNIYKNPYTYLFYHHCDTCDGNGVVRCRSCGGKGNISCSHCHGKGYTVLYSNVNKIETCSDCHGNGYTTCSTCHGQGQITCSKCKKSGWLTDTVRTYLKTTPQYSVKYLKLASENLRKVMKKVKAKEIANYCGVSLYDSYRDDGGDFLTRYVCRIPIAEAEVKIHGSISKWVLFGVNPVVLDAGGAMDHVMNSKISILDNCEVSLSHPYATARIKLNEFLSYEINAKILEENIEEDNINIICEKLNNSVSQQYISKALAAVAEISKKVLDVNEKILRIAFAVLPNLILIYFHSAFAGFKSGGGLTFFSIILLVASLFLIVFLLNKWYRLSNMEIFRAWCKKRGFTVSILKNLNTIKMLIPSLIIFIFIILIL